MTCTIHNNATGKKLDTEFDTYELAEQFLDDVSETESTEYHIEAVLL